MKKAAGRPERLGIVAAERSPPACAKRGAAMDGRETAVVCRAMLRICTACDGWGRALSQTAGPGTAVRVSLISRALRPENQPPGYWSGNQLVKPPTKEQIDWDATQGVTVTDIVATAGPRCEACGGSGFVEYDEAAAPRLTAPPG